MTERRPRRLDSDALWQYALKTLGSRAHSTGELRQKLNRRAERPEDVDETLVKLKEHGYLNDRRFAEGYAAARLSNDKFGRTRVVQDLRRRRVAPSLAENATAAAYEGVDETTLIDDWIKRKYRLAPRDALFQDQKDLGAAYRRLMRAGFRSGDVIRALKRFAKDPELLDGFEPPPDDSENAL